MKPKWMLLCLAFATCELPLGVPSQAANPAKPVPSKSVVKIFSSIVEPNLLEPWKKEAAEDVSGTGVVIEGKRILTNAHVVNHAASVTIQPNQSGEKFRASVEYIAPDIDLAVLKLKDESFFDTHQPMAMTSALPKVRERVVVAGYPLGGETLSMTEGIVSRIEYTEYYYDRSGVRVQIDAAVNSGNSGGPALVDGKLIGIVFSTLDQAENIGYIIPVDEIELFLEDVKDGKYDGKPVLPDLFDLVQNDALRAKLKMPKGVNGVVLTHPSSSDENYPLKRFDVVTKIADQPIDASGDVQFDDDLKLWFKYVVPRKMKDGKITLDILRGGEPMKVEVAVETLTQKPKLLPWLYHTSPSYLIWGPLSFSPASKDSIWQFVTPSQAPQMFPDLMSSNSPLLTRFEDYPAFEGEQLVLLTTMLPHHLTQGYRGEEFVVVDTVDGVKVRNLRHLAELLRDAKGEDLTITFSERDAEVLVFKLAEVEESTEEILSVSGIRKPYSDDLKPVYESKK